MRYRPFGNSGQSVSCLTLSVGYDSLARGPAAVRELIFSALENGINSFRLESPDPVLAEAVGQALSSVDRKLVFVHLSLGRRHQRKEGVRDFSTEHLTSSIEKAMRLSGFGYLDVVMLEDPADEELPQATLNALKALRATEKVKALGVLGGGDVMDAYVSTNAFDVLATPYHVNSDWAVRHRLREAKERDMAVLAYEVFPDYLSTARRAAASDKAPKKGLFSFGKPKASPESAGGGTFAFLHRTPNWTAEEICIAYALTEPAVSSVIVAATDIDRLTALAAVPERDMPPGLGAQIEMARVGSATAA